MSVCVCACVCMCVCGELLRVVDPPLGMRSAPTALTALGSCTPPRRRALAATRARVCTRTQAHTTRARVRTDGASRFFAYIRGETRLRRALRLIGQIKSIKARRDGAGVCRHARPGDRSMGCAQCAAAGAPRVGFAPELVCLAVASARRVHERDGRADVSQRRAQPGGGRGHGDAGAPQCCVRPCTPARAHTRLGWMSARMPRAGAGGGHPIPLRLPPSCTRTRAHSSVCA
jgi:hypothetical protein